MTEPEELRTNRALYVSRVLYDRYPGLMRMSRDLYDQSRDLYDRSRVLYDRYRRDKIRL